MTFSVKLPQHLKHDISFSCGEVARQANGSVLASYGETVVLATACMSPEPREGAGFLPLMVDYRAKTYAMGKIPGGFIKREGAPTDTEKLCARLIDRPLRPLFPDGLTHDIQIVALVLSSDGENDPDVLAVNAASCALLASDIPFQEAVAAVRVARVEDELIVNPGYEQRQQANFDIVVVATEEKIVMIEGQLDQVPEEQVLEALKLAKEVTDKIIVTQRQVQDKMGKPKKEVSLYKINDKVLQAAREEISDKLESVYQGTKADKKQMLNQAQQNLENKFQDNEDLDASMIQEALSCVEQEFVRNKIVNQQVRPDGRQLNQIREIDSKVKVLPRPHGSAIFTRGQTQSLALVTLGTSSDEQRIDGLSGEDSKRFMLHYSFPPFSVGDVKFLRGPSRREVGHGALAEKALSCLIPSEEQFPYTIRIVSEILESNGSSSMATVCSSSLALMDAGVPIESAVAGVALGLIEQDGKHCILTDIAGLEDHYGDMDFKVAGTTKGITAIQVDVKNQGLSLELVKDILSQAREGRLYILDKMNQVLAASRSQLSDYAPRIKTMPIDRSKIGELIGPGGKMIRHLTTKYDATIDIDDEQALVSVATNSQENLDALVNEIEQLTKDVEVGEIYQATVDKITNFGAFCKITPNKSGLLHISEISNQFTKDVRDRIKEGDQFPVKVISIDDQGRINLSKKQAE